MSNTSDFVDLLNREMDSLLDDYAKRRIADLEAKLAEKDNTIANLSHKASKEAQNALDNFKRIKQLEIEVELARNTSINTNKMDIIHLQAENLELEQQLAEKEKQVNTYAKEIVFLDKKISDIKNSCDYYMNRANNLLLKDQDKISFAVEQLEGLKTAIYNLSYTERVLKTDCYEEIDNQIAELKKGVE